MDPDPTSVARLLADAREVCVLTGAGISTESGIPDYRGPNGLWTRDQQAARMSTLADYVADPAVRRRAWRGRLEHPVWQAEPNAGHLALVDLERAGRLHSLLTQNIDGLHQRAGSDPGIVVELHGNLHETECLRCAARGPMAATLERVRAGDPDPACLVCGGLLKSATISFGQPLDRDALERARRASLAADVFLAVGSSLSVQPAAGLCALAAESGAVLIILNAAPTPYDSLAAFRLPGALGALLPQIASDTVDALAR